MHRLQRVNCVRLKYIVVGLGIGFCGYPAFIEIPFPSDFSTSHAVNLNILVLAGRSFGDENFFIGQIHDQRYIGLAEFLGRQIAICMGADGVGFVEMIF